jgi:uncharacterized protein (DUF983 family)
MNTHAPDFWLTVLRTLIGRCPQCGHGRLFKSYLKPVESCASCGEKLGHIRADDGPAWLTILLVGHVLGSVVLATSVTSWPEWVILTFVLSLTIVLSLAVLPFAKGFFIGLIWRAGCIGTEK